MDQEDHSSLCHFKPFAFPHPICDGALTCFSFSLQWQQHHRNQVMNGKCQNKNGSPIKDSVGQRTRRVRRMTSLRCSWRWVRLLETQKRGVWQKKKDASLSIQAIKNDSPCHEDPHFPCLSDERALASKTRSTIVPKHGHCVCKV